MHHWTPGRSLFLALFVLASCASTQRPGESPAGRMAPSFSLPDGEGNTVSLDQLTTDGAVVLVFFRGHW